MAPQTGARLAGIQALRGAAATAVVFSHAARHVNAAFGVPWLIAAFQSGHAGVDLFFVISGFIIMFVHGRDIGQPGRLNHYAARRFTRVMPLYWLALALTVAMQAASSHGLPAPTWLLWCAALLPTWHHPILTIAWTLQFEVVFYTVFAVLILHRRAGIALLGAWMVWVILAAASGLDAVVPYALCGTFSLEFCLGMAVAALVRRGVVPRPRLLAAAGLMLFAAAWALESAGLLNGFSTTARVAYSIPAALLVLGVAAADLAVPAWLDAIGTASYSIYLFQFIFIGPAWQVLAKLGVIQPVVCFLALAAAALLGGVGVSKLIEQPLLRAWRG